MLVQDALRDVIGPRAALQPRQKKCCCVHRHLLASEELEALSGIALTRQGEKGDGEIKISKCDALRDHVLDAQEGTRADNF